MLTASLLLCFGIATASKVTITQFAVPNAVKVGENAELQCQYQLDEPETASLYVKWWWTPLSDPDLRHPIYQRLGHHAPQVVNNGDVEILGNDTIVLLNLIPSESGTYECEVSNIDEARRKQQLIVYTQGTGPSLNISAVQNGTDDTDVRVTCEAAGAAPKPELVITVDGKVIEVDEMTLSDPVEGEYSVSANTTLEELEVGSEVRCELFFADKNVTHEAYIAEEVYEGSGEGPSTTEAVDTTEEDALSTTSLPDGSDSLHCHWWIPVVAAAVAHILAAQ